MGHLYISDSAWYESTSLKNPICTMDHRLAEYAPRLYRACYDTRISVVKSPTKQERAVPFYNDYRERYGTPTLPPLSPKPKNVFLCGFRQEDLRAVTPRIKETTEVLYLYKCPRIKDLSMLSEFTELRCVHMYWNHSLECLWDMRSNRFLQAISFVDVSGLQSIDGLKDSAAEYVCLDSADNNGKRRKMQFDPQVLDQMKHLKHLILNYVGYKTD